MNTKVSFRDLERYVDGECSPEQSERIEHEITQDPALARQASELVKIGSLLRDHATQTKASMSLRASIGEPVESTPAPEPRRRWLIGSAAALAAGVAGFTSHQLLRGDALGINEVADTFFRDFETYLLKDRSLDIAQSNSLKVARWYESRLPFTLPPISATGAGASLVGGRLCWLLERRLASLSYESAHGPIVLYITQSRGIDIPSPNEKSALGDNLSWHRSGQYTSVIWHKNGLMLAMVGAQELRKLMAIAHSVAG